MEMKSFAEIIQNLDLVNILMYLSGFVIIAVASGQIGKVFKKIHLPLITGFLILGLIAGPEVLGLLNREAISGLRFINDIALAFIALAVGSELYIKELRSRLFSIKWMTFSQLFITFILGSTAMFLLSDIIPFMKSLPLNARISVALLAGTIFVARSPASAIAIVNEMRARGPFTQTALGVTVVKDFIVIILFSVIFTLSKSLIKSEDFRYIFIFQALFELIMAFGFGYLFGVLLVRILVMKEKVLLKKILVLLVGFLAYVITKAIAHYTLNHYEAEFHVEPLLVCILGSFIVSNYSKYRDDFLKIIKEVGPVVYTIFFTLTGASIFLDVISDLWMVTLIIFFVRILSLVVAGYIGNTLAGDPPLFGHIGWMPYVTQAGVGLGLATIIAVEYPGWGARFSTLMISVIVLNQLLGPPLFKWAINLVKEGHTKAEGFFATDSRRALIFGMENHAVALARQLVKHDWQVEIASIADLGERQIADKDINLIDLQGLELENLTEIEAQKYDTFICLLSDDENYRICELAYEKFGTKHLIVRLHDRKRYAGFQKLGAMLIEPNTAMVSLMEHYVRAPMATSILLGMDEGQDSIDMEVLNPDIHGLSLRQLRLPADVIVLSVTRNDQPIISHGYTTLRLHDLVTLVGAPASLENIRLRLEG
jgi:Trk K+ transport system NAD-binding subunit/Kef-type K+ transport system membrane component KefB